MQGGQPLPFDGMVRVPRCVSPPQIRLNGAGPGRGVLWGCDLSDQYVRINADYTT